MKKKWGWNISKSNRFRVERVRNYTITPVGIETSNRHQEGFKITAWFTDSETVDVGEVDTIEEATQYVELMTQEESE
jgi:hypothetical protein